MAYQPENDPVVRIVEAAVTVTMQHMSAYFLATMAELRRSLVADFYREFAGQYIPKNTRLWRAERDAKIIAAYRAGRAVADLSKEFHLS